MSEQAEQVRRRRESGADTLRPAPALLPELKTILFPIRLLTLVCLLTIVAFAWFGWILLDLGRDAKIFLDKGSRIEELRGVIVHLDEVLTMSARMAAETGDSRWEERYRQFEPQLDAAIKDTTKIGTGPSNLEAATKMDAANVKLVEMENRAFALVRAGRKEEAQVVLFSPEYETQKKIYVEGITSFGDQIRRNLDESLREEKRADLLLIIGALGVGGASLVAWWSAARGVRRWRAQMLDSFSRRAEAEENLRKAHAELERRVKERTAELSQTNEALQLENVERMRAEEKLRASQQFIESIINAIPVRIFWKDRNLVYLGCNAAFARDSGLGEAKEVIGKDDYQMAWSDRAELYRADDRHVIESGRPKLLIEEPLTTPDGNIVTILTSKIPLRNAKGEISGVLGTFVDITERKQAEDQLKTSFREINDLKAALDEHAIVAITDPQGKITYVNDKFCAISKYSREELLGQDHRIIKSGFHSKEFMRHLWTTIARGEVWKAEVNNKAKDGSFYWVSSTIVPFLNEQGKPRQYVAIRTDITERKQAEDALRASEAHLQTVVENLNEGVVVCDLNGKLLHWNRAALEIHGIANVDDGARKLTELVDTFELSAIDGTRIPVEEWPLSRILRGESLHDLELRVRNIKTGLQRIFNYGGTLVHDANNQPLLGVVTISDITERKQTEDLIRASEVRYRALFESNPSPMWVYDLETLSFLAVNAAAVKHYGYSQDEFRAMTIKDIRPSEDIPALDDLSQKNDDLDHSKQWRHCTKDGRLNDVEITSHELTWLGRRAKVALINDITERKRAEETLREQTDIINRAHDAIIIRNFENESITFWNKGAEHLYGWNASEAIGRTIGDLIFGGPKEREEPLNVLLSTGEFHGEIKQVTKDGREIMVDCRATLVREAAGQARSVLLINTDVTEQKKLETQLLRAQRLESIGTLASGVAHDLNNILTPILICAEVLRENTQDEDSIRTLQLIDYSARRGAAIVKQVLTFARGVEGKRVLIKPSHLIQELVDIAQKTFPKSIEIKSAYSDEVWSIEADPTQLHQVLLNLSVNARDAMPNGGVLTVAAENFEVDENYASMISGAKSGAHVMLRVSDTGSGMPRSVIEKIFDPFFTTKEIGKGTGLGLSTALGIVKSHGGFVSVYSEVGAGTTFKIFLPAQMSDVGGGKSKVSLESLNGNGELILVVDDEPNILGVTKMILEKHNYQVLAANDGPEALASIAEKKSSIHAVLTDISMPYMSGVAVVRATRKMKPEMLFIASTGQGEEAHVSELRSLGVTNLLAKPYDSAKLLQALHDALLPA